MRRACAHASKWGNGVGVVAVDLCHVYTCLLQSLCVMYTHALLVLTHPEEGAKSVSQQTTAWPWRLNRVPLLQAKTETILQQVMTGMILLQAKPYNPATCLIVNRTGAYCACIAATASARAASTLSRKQGQKSHRQCEHARCSCVRLTL